MVQATKVAEGDILLIEDDRFFQNVVAEAVKGIDARFRLRVMWSGEDLRRFMRSGQPDPKLALVDLVLPDADGVSLIGKIRRRFPTTAILVISGVSDPAKVLQSVREGAHGYVLKGDTSLTLARSILDAISGRHPISPSLAGALFDVAGGKSPGHEAASTVHGGRDSSAGGIVLTKKEEAVLQHLAEGCTYRQTAVAMSVSLSTVQTHVRGLYRKLGARSQVQAVQAARAAGILPRHHD
jgi:DNA-binding NarL/FixJ family response regulator